MKDNNFIQKLKNKKIFIISPHYDDAILSTGMLLLKLKKYKNVTVINCFTKAHKGPYTFSARKFLRDSGLHSDARELLNERGREDEKALLSLGVNIINLGLEEALFRRHKKGGVLGKIIPELTHVYPTYKWHITKSISSTDNALKELKRKFKKYTDKNAYYFIPYGIGNHVDHRITRMASEKMFANIILYSEFPYNSRLRNLGQAKKGQRIYTLNSRINEKKLLIRLYASQFRGLFPDGKIPRHEEIYFADKKIWK